MKSSPHLLFIFNARVSCILTLLVVSALSGCSQAQPSLNARGMLYICKEGALYGLCNEQKKVIVKPSFTEINWNPPYFVCKWNSLLYLLDSHGQVLDSGRSIEYVIDSSFVLYPLTATVVTPKRGPFSKTTPLSKQIFHKNGSYEYLPGGVVSVATDNESRLNRLVVDSGDLQALLQIAPLKILYPFKYKHLDWRSGYFFAWSDSNSYELVDRDGNSRALPSSLGTAQVFAVGRLFAVDSTFYMPGKPFRMSQVKFYDSSGRLIRIHPGTYKVINTRYSNESYSTSDYFVLNHGLATEEKDVSLMDHTGKILLDHIDQITPAYGSLIVTSHKLPKDPHTYQGYEPDGIYDLDRKQFVVRSPETGGRIVQGPYMVYFEQDSFRSVYDGTGKVIARFRVGGKDKYMADIERYKTSYGFYDRPSTPGFDQVPYVRYTYSILGFRSDSTQPFTLFSSNMMKRYPQQLQEFLPGNAHWEIFGMQNGKWGVWRVDDAGKRHDFHSRIKNELVQVVEPVYDRIERAHPLYKAILNGKIQWLDSMGQKLAGDRQFDYIDNSSIDGRWIAFDRKKDVRASVHIIDRSGKIFATLKPLSAGVINELHKNVDYRLLSESKILCFTQSGEIIWDAKTGSKTKLPVSFWVDNLLYTNSGKPIAAIFRSDNQDYQEGVYSFITREVVVPPASYGVIKCRPYGNAALAFYGNDGYFPDRLFAILDQNGKLYK